MDYYSASKLSVCLWLGDYVALEWLPRFIAAIKIIMFAARLNIYFYLLDSAVKTYFCHRGVYCIDIIHFIIV